ncbi:Hypothetical protein, putative [Bodo saltans]|uniref:Membrane-associated protein n=1 Tax=Bodo saltans TaxID=75058 RepID=A0A0S4J7B7_BODSA|nr:Hypothetical protein, putative [Bodo saltans]|eukprot:CUG86355.1 Hypothetical protein, putative [Bodo saltans]
MLRFHVLTLLIALVIMMTLSCFSSCEEIPCTNTTTTSSTSPFLLNSNATYTLTDCVSDLAFIDLAPSPSEAEAFENVTIRVHRGNVLPRLRFANVYLLRIRDIDLSVKDVFVSAFIEISSGGASIATAMMDISGAYLLTAVDDVRITIVGSSIYLNVSVNATYVTSAVAPLWYLMAPANGVTISAFNGTIQDSNVSIAVNISGASGAYQNVVAIAALGTLQYTGNMLHVAIQVVNSTLSLTMKSAAHPNVTYNAANPAIFNLRSAQQGSSTAAAVLQGVALTSSGGSRFFVHVEAPSTSSDIASIWSLRFAVMRDIVVDLQRNTVASIDTVCGGDECRTTLVSNYPSARIVEIEGASIASNHSIRAHGCTFSINSPKEALVFTWQNCQRLSSASAHIEYRRVCGTVGDIWVGRRFHG